MQQLKPIVSSLDLESLQWISVNDTVMGGVSLGDSKIEGEEIVFEGELSLENNGGFSSIRTNSPPPILEGTDGLLLRVKGDGKTYQFRIRTDSSSDGVSYSQRLQTKAGEWTVVELPFTKFVLGYRGRVIPDYGPLEPHEIKTLGILISDNQEGPFRLRIGRIEIYENRSR